mgnify:CR=1 FL=1|jgi:hypothetical protein
MSEQAETDDATGQRFIRRSVVCPWRNLDRGWQAAAIGLSVVGDVAVGLPTPW